MRDKIETIRLRLTACTLNDIDEFHGLFSDPLTHTIGAGPFTSRAETVDWLERRLKTKQDYGFVWYGIRHREGGPLIGGCGILASRTGVLEPEIGYEIKHSERGNGLALEAAQAVVSELQATTTVKRLWATVRPLNAASLRICERLGLVLDRVETDKRGELLYLVRDLA
ncbi:GNAT family N-acetyltransferase [Nonomuraea sp. CA-143628]|uniref:GNAT family N-acetyltransferase n=1 Tax=Nonomuraea sp. CA-143628 TaxID=3239997 RepID=UPI003D93FAEC